MSKLLLVWIQTLMLFCAVCFTLKEERVPYADYKRGHASVAENLRQLTLLNPNLLSHGMKSLMSPSSLIMHYKRSSGSKNKRRLRQLLKTKDFLDSLQRRVRTLRLKHHANLIKTKKLLKRLKKIKSIDAPHPIKNERKIKMVAVPLMQLRDAASNISINENTSELPVNVAYIPEEYLRHLAPLEMYSFRMAPQLELQDQQPLPLWMPMEPAQPPYEIQLTDGSPPPPTAATPPPPPPDED